MANGKVFEAIVSIAGKLDPSLQKSIVKAEKSTKGLSKGLKIAGAVGAAGVAALGTAAVATAVKFTKAAAEYEENFAKTATLLNGTKEELDAYSDSILNLSNETGIAAGELTETVYSAISAGIDQADAVEFAGQAAKLAAGGFTDSATAVDVMTTALNAYGLEADQAGQISDYLITTQNLGKTTVDELASSVGKVIPVASAYGVEMDNLSTAYAQMTAGGIATAEAGTYLKTMLSELGDSGSTVSAVLQEQTGKSFAELTKEGKSLGDVVDILGKSVDGDSGAFNELWSSSTAGVGALSLLNSGAESYNETLAKMQGSLGATDAAYGTMTDTVSHHLETIKNLGTNFAISAGQEILPIVSEILKDFIPVLENLSEQALPKVKSTIEAIAPVIQTIGPAVMNVLPTTMGAMSKIQGVFWGTIQKFLPVISNVINLISGLIQSLAEELIPFIEGIIKIIEPVINMAISGIIPIMNTIIQIAGQIIQIVIKVLSAVLPVITQIIQIVAELWTELISKLMPALTGVFEAIIPIIESATNIISAVLPVVIKILQFLMPILSLVANILSTILGGAINFVIRCFRGVIGIVSSVMSVFEGIIGFMQTFVSTWTAIWNGIGQIVSNAFTGLVGIVKAPINTIIGMVNGVISKINSAGFTIPSWVPGIGGKSFSLNVSTLPMLATGGHTNGPSIAGEAGPETVISYDPRFRKKNVEYWKQAGAMLGIDSGFLAAITGRKLAKDESFASVLETGSVSNNSRYNIESIQYNPTIIIQGSADKKTVKEALKESKEEFFDKLDEWWEDKTGGGDFDPEFA